MEQEEFKYIIIGGGICGLTTSIELTKINPGGVLLIEKENDIGGLLRTIEKDGSFYDLGSHIIHYEVDNDTLEYINKVSNNSLIKKLREGKLILRKSFIDYPIKSIQFMIGLGCKESFLCILSLIKSRIFKAISILNKSKANNYESNLIKNVGKKAYNLFYKPYALKVWACDPKLISNTAIRRQMAMIGPIMLIKEIIKYFIRGKNLKYYYYLEGGIGQFPKGLERIAHSQEVKIITNVEDLKIDNKTLNIHVGKKKYQFQFEKLISTIPIDDLLSKLKLNDSLKDIKNKIEWRGLKLVFLHVKEDVIVEGESFYLPETNYKIGRVSVPKRFSELMQKNQEFTSIICEIPCSENDDIWNMSINEVTKICYYNLKEANIIMGDNYFVSELNFYINIKNVYPMYYMDWKDIIKSALKYLSHNYPYIYTSGKAGFFMQSNLDRSIDMGFKLAEFILAGKTPEQWYTQLDYYQNLLLRD